MKAKELKKYPFYIILMTISFLITMVSPLLFSYLIDEIIINGNFSMLLRWFVITFLVTAAGLVMDFYFVNYSPVKIGIRNSFKLERKSLGNILKLNQPIYAQKDKGYYYNLCQNSAGAYGDLHEELHLNMVSNIIYVVVILSFITYVNRIFGLFFVAYGLVLVFIALNSAKPLYHMQKDILQVQDVYLTDMRNIIENKGNINAIHAEDFFNQAFKKSVTKYEKHILKYRLFDYLCQYLPGALNQICTVAFLFIAAILVMKGEITAGTLLMGYQYMGYFATPITKICSIAMRYKSNKIHIERVDGLETEAQEPKENEPYKKEDGLLLKASNFDFYKGENKEDFLYHIDNMELKKNGLYVIKGDNGSGKSMLMNLLLGNVSAKNSRGDISISKDIDDTVFLTYPFFAVNGSFDDNLYGVAGNRELEDMLRVDFADKEITGTPVNLSYGQQQKLALMRIFCRNAPILFLDEPLSNLDVETQDKLIQYIQKLKGTKTILVIMHSNELDEAADGIIMIENHKMYMK